MKINNIFQRSLYIFIHSLVTFVITISEKKIPVNDPPTDFSTSLSN